MKVILILFVILFLASPFGHAGQEWTVYDTIEVIDSLPAENSTYITLKNYSNSVCSENRILLEGGTESEFNQMFSMVLSAFHSNAKVSFLLHHDNDCKAYRVLLSK